MQTLNMQKESFRIIQFTDLHLMYQDSDYQTYNLMKNSINHMKPDLIVITGDITMTLDNKNIIVFLRDFLDSFKVNWTFVFGNHDHESQLSLDEQADLYMKGKYCLFEKGDVSLRGCGNYYIDLQKDEKTVAMLGFLDSHNSTTYLSHGARKWTWDYIDFEQINDAVKNINQLKEKKSEFSSLFFFHIPLVDFKTEVEENKDNCIGVCYEDVSCSDLDNDFHYQLERTNTLRGVFVGHDHVCDFQFVKDKCLYAFGRCTGHYNYVKPDYVKGARIIDIDALGNVKSHVIFEG